MEDNGIFNSFTANFFLQKSDDKQRNSTKTEGDHNGYLASVILVKRFKGKKNDNKHTTTTQNTGRKSGSTLTFNKDFSY